MASTTVGIKLDDATRERLRNLGATRQRSAHWLMKEAISRYLEVEERYEREKAEDQAEWDRYVRTGVSFSHEDVKAHLHALAGEAARRSERP